MPTIAAANTLSATAYKTASGERRNDTQKGSKEARGSVAVADPAESERGDHDSCQSRHSRQNQRLYEELGNNAAAARAQRRAQTDLRLAHRCARIHENRDVQTDKHEQSNKNTLHREETGHIHGSVDASKRPRVRHRLGPQRRVDFWKRQGGALADGCQFGLRTCERRAGCEPPEHHKSRPRQWLGRRKAHAQRHPEVIVDGEGEALRHHADDGMRSGSQLNSSSQNGGVTREPIPPDVLADHDHGRCALALVFLLDIPAHQRPDPGHSESRGTHRRNADALGLCAGSDQVWRKDSECADLLNGFQLFAPDVVIAQNARFRIACRRVPNLNRDKAVAFIEGHRRSQEVVID